eukprot:4753941-Prymnesium_polylepis.3
MKNHHRQHGRDEQVSEVDLVGWERRDGGREPCRCKLVRHPRVERVDSLAMRLDGLEAIGIVILRNGTCAR